MRDLIDRAAAIDAIKAASKEIQHWLWEAEGCEGYCAMVADVETCLDDLPSVQPEPLTDKEQRIFLAAMGREEKVCKQVDEECRDCREPYEDSLVSTCHEITRKVKGALWT